MTSKLKSLSIPNQPKTGQIITVYTVNGQIKSEYDAIMKYGIYEVTEYKVLNPLKFRDAYVIRNLNDNKTYCLKHFAGQWQIT